MRRATNTIESNKNNGVKEDHIALVIEGKVMKEKN